MTFSDDGRIVLTLDAGGSKLEFNALQGGRVLVPPVRMPARGDDLDAGLAQIRSGFEQVHEATGRRAAAISFGFPGPADYEAGIILAPPNLPAFRDVPLASMLRERFRLPVFINNDGALFTAGEAVGGLLAWVNERSAKQYRNLLGFTLGTGFGGGVCIGGRLVRGDNSSAGEVWSLRHRDDRGAVADEGVSIRGLQRAFAEAAGAPAPGPREIEAIALGRVAGNREAALSAFRRLGEVAGDAIASALCVVDGLVVVGGGLSAASRLFLPSLVRELNGQLRCREAAVDRLEVRAFDLDDPDGVAGFLREPGKRTGVAVSRLGTSAAAALGAYVFALDQLDSAPQSR
jgi:glucokinase